MSRQTGATGAEEVTSTWQVRATRRFAVPMPAPVVSARKSAGLARAGKQPVDDTGQPVLVLLRGPAAQLGEQLVDLDGQYRPQPVDLLGRDSTACDQRRA